MRPSQIGADRRSALGYRISLSGDTEMASNTTQDSSSGAPCFLVLVLIMMIVGYVFIWMQASLIADLLLFWALICFLITTAFWASATEAAFSLAPTRGEILQAVSQEFLGFATKLEPIDQAIATSGSHMLSPQQEKTRGRLLRKIKRVTVKRRALDGTERDEYVGSLSAFSVFLNAGLTAFLPLSLVDAIAKEETTNILVLGAWDFTFPNSKILVFVASALPVLLLGKMIPKMIGFRYPMFFAYRMFWFGRAVKFVLGWIALGVRWPISSFIIKRAT